MCKTELDSKVRECGAAYGMDIYTDNELLSIVTSIPTDKFAGTLGEIFDCPTRIAGIGKKKELALFAIQEIAKRLLRDTKAKLPVIHGPEDAADYAIPRISLEQKEHFCVMLLDTKNHVIGWETVSVGSLTASIVHPREVFAPVAVHHAAAVILVHNHPSGDPTPSREDIAMTERLVKAGKILDIPVLDHIVIGRGKFTSLKEQGLVK